MEEQRIRNIFRYYDECIGKYSNWIDYDLPISEFGTFSKSFLTILSSFLQAHKERQENFNEICEETIKQLNYIGNFIQNNQKHLSLLHHIVELLENLNNDEEQKINEVQTIATSLYTILKYKLYIENLSISFLSNKSNIKDTDPTKKSLQECFKWIKTLIFEDTQQVDPFLLSVESCEHFIHYIRCHTKPLPHCDCGRKAYVYAIPCSCPCYCRECWNSDPSLKDQTICPMCCNPITEFVEIE